MLVGHGQETMAATTDAITVSSSSTPNVDNHQLPIKPITQQEIKDRLQAILVDPSNKICADCPALNPNQISLLQTKLVDKTDGNFLCVGVFCCDECSKSHRKLGNDICVVKRLFDEFTVEEVQSLEQSGNDFVNTLLEATAFQGEKTSKARDIFILEKYKQQKYLSQEKLHQQLVLRQKAARYASLLKKPEPSSNPRASGRLLKRTGSVPNLFSIVNNFKMDDPSLPAAAATRNNSDHERTTTTAAPARSSPKPATKPTAVRSIANEEDDDDDGGSSSPKPKEKSQRMTRSSSKRGLVPSSGRASSQRNLSPRRSSSQRNVLASPKPSSSSQRGLARSSDNRQSSSTSDLTSLKNKKKNPNSTDLRTLMLSPEAEKKRSVVAPYSPHDGGGDDSSDEEEDEVGRAQAALKLVVNHHGAANKNEKSSQQELEQNLSLLASPKAQQPSLEDSLASLASNTAPEGNISPKGPTRTKLLGSEDENDHSPTTPPALRKRNRRRRDRNEQQLAAEEGSANTEENKPLTKKERIEEICEKPENLFCSECDSTPKPIWAFFLTCPIDGKRLAGLCCDACYNIFMNLGEGDFTHKSTKTVALWTDEEMEALEFCGNKMINAVYEAKLKGEKEESYKLEHGREAFFFEKYINFRFLSGRIYKDIMAQIKKEEEKKERGEAREKKMTERLNSRRNLVDDAKGGEGGGDDKALKRRGSRRNLSPRPEDDGGGGMTRSSSTPGLVSSGMKSGEQKDEEKVMKRRNSRRNLMERPEGSGRTQRSSSQRRLSAETGRPEGGGGMQRSSSQRRFSAESGEEKRRIKKSSSGPNLMAPRSKPAGLSSPGNPSMSKPGLSSERQGGQRQSNQSSSPNLLSLRASLSKPGLVSSAALSAPPTKGGNATFARQSKSGSNLSAMLQSGRKSPAKGTLLDEFIAQRRKDCSDRNQFAQNPSPSSMNSNGQSGVMANRERTSQKWDQLINSVKGANLVADASNNG